jgi:hypothetical protein
MGMTVKMLRVKKEQLDSFLENSLLFEEYIDSEEMQEHETKLDLYKFWDGLNYLLCNNSKADTFLSKAIFSGQILDNEQDLGYGPAQYSTIEQVVSISEAFDNIPEGEIEKTFNAEAMNLQGVYLSPWQENEDDIAELMNYYRQLKAFYLEAAKEKEAVISYIE